MFIRIEDLKDICSKISSVVEISENDQITGVLELTTDGTNLNLIVSNHEYYVKAKIDLRENIIFNAAVSASKFLQLITSTTSDVVELQVEGNALVITGNGTYKLPLVFEGEKMVHVPEIKVENVTQEFAINTEILHNIYSYNTKEILRSAEDKTAPDVQRLYYMDEEGCITYTNYGACVNRFSLAKPVKLLMNLKLVKLFKLFTDSSVMFSMGHTALSETLVQTRVKFEDSNVMVVDILPSDEVTSVPAPAIRKRAYNDYKYSININKVAMLDALKRLLLLSNTWTDNDCRTGKFKFDSEFVTITDFRGINKETVFYEGICDLLNNPYEALLDLVDTKNALEKCPEAFVTLSFGGGQAFVASRGNIFNVFTEGHM